MRLELARTFSLTSLFDKAEQHDGCGLSRRTGGEGDKAHVASEEEQRDSHRIPDPAISQPRRGDHPKTQPSRRAPAVDLPHDLVVAGLYELPDHPSSGHGCTSSLRAAPGNSG